MNTKSSVTDLIHDLDEELARVPEVVFEVTVSRDNIVDDLDLGMAGDGDGLGLGMTPPGEVVS